MNEQTVVYLFDGILFSHNKDEVLIHDTTWMSLENIIQHQRSQTHKRTHIVCIKHPELVKKFFLEGMF